MPTATEIVIEEWLVPNLTPFEHCTVEADFAIDDGVITRVIRVWLTFTKKGYPKQTRSLNGVPVVLEKQIIAALEADLENILNYIEANDYWTHIEENKHGLG